mmetsp:Transcript_45504/g.74322  ORF Transcript_45504/g.74322 Transcript_45504/m.74322 type:complete len:210 (+) Transcript_45504:1430-2059(+)
MSRATISGPVRLTRVETGCRLRVCSISAMGARRSTSTAGCSSSSRWGRYFAGSVSSLSKNSPSAVIFALIWRSAEHDTPMPTGQDAPWRGSRTTRTSWQKYFPPNCAPMPISWVICNTAFSHSRSRQPCPKDDPFVGSASRSCVDAALTVLRLNSADVPPMTMARWYGGHAAVPNSPIASFMNARRLSGLRMAFVFWYKNVLLAEPPPF